MAAAACVVAAAILAGCGSSDSSSGKPAVCSSVSDLKTSVTDLKNVNIRTNGISAVGDQLSKIEQQLKTVKADAAGQYSSQTDALSKALTGLSSSVSTAKDNLNGGTLHAVASSAGTVVTAGNNLISAVSSTC